MRRQQERLCCRCLPLCPLLAHRSLGLACDRPPQALHGPLWLWHGCKSSRCVCVFVFVFPFSQTPLDVTPQQTHEQTPAPRCGMPTSSSKIPAVVSRWSSASRLWTLLCALRASRSPLRPSASRGVARVSAVARRVNAKRKIRTCKNCAKIVFVICRSALVGAR
jgi:hypothetical protein